MHGLNTQISNGGFTQVDMSYTVGSLYGATVQSVNMASPETLALLISEWSTGDNQTQYYLKRAYQKQILRNVGNFPIIFERIALYCRLDSTLTPITILELGTQAGPIVNIQTTGMPYQPITHGEEARKYFKVLSTKRRVIQAGRTWNVISRIPPKYTRKSITPQVEGDTTYQFRKGNVVYIHRFYGVPCNWTNSVGLGTDITGVTTVHVRGFFYRYCSYYRMDDATTTTNTFNGAGWTELSVAGNTAAGVMGSGGQITHGYDAGDPAGRVASHQLIQTS